MTSRKIVRKDNNEALANILVDDLSYKTREIIYQQYKDEIRQVLLIAMMKAVRHLGVHDPSYAKINEEDYVQDVEDFLEKRWNNKDWHFDIDKLPGSVKEGDKVNIKKLFSNGKLCLSLLKGKGSRSLKHTKQAMYEVNFENPDDYILTKWKMISTPLKAALEKEAADEIDNFYRRYLNTIFKMTRLICPAMSILFLKQQRKLRELMIEYLERKGVLTIQRKKIEEEDLSELLKTTTSIKKSFKFKSESDLTKYSYLAIFRFLVLFYEVLTEFRNSLMNESSQELSDGYLGTVMKFFQKVDNKKPFYRYESEFFIIIKDKIKASKSKKEFKKNIHKFLVYLIERITELASSKEFDRKIFEGRFKQYLFRRTLLEIFNFDKKMIDELLSKFGEQK